MTLTPSNINMYLLLKLPAAYFCGVRLKEIDNSTCLVSVRHRWINQNPFNSMYFAIQAMAAELSTGALVMREIRSADRNISMLVTASSAIFMKKATGRINFRCSDGPSVSEAVMKAISSGEKQVLNLTSIGINAEGEKVCEMTFEWNIKLRD